MRFNSFEEETEVCTKLFEKYEGQCEYQASDYCTVIKEDCGAWLCPKVAEELEGEE